MIGGGEKNAREGEGVDQPAEFIWELGRRERFRRREDQSMPLQPSSIRDEGGGFRRAKTIDGGSGSQEIPGRPKYAAEGTYGAFERGLGRSGAPREMADSWSGRWVAGWIRFHVFCRAAKECGVGLSHETPTAQGFFQELAKKNAVNSVPRTVAPKVGHGGTVFDLPLFRLKPPSRFDLNPD